MAGKEGGRPGQHSLYWRIGHGDIPTMEGPISLQRGDVCYFCCEARWLEYPKRTQTVSLSRRARTG